MKLRRIISIFLAGLTLGFTSCGAPNSVDPVVTDPIRIVAPGVSDDTNVGTSTAQSTTGQGTGTMKVTTPTQPVDGKSRVSFLAVGDNIIHENVFTDAKNRAKTGEKYNFIDMYTDIADFIAGADIAFVNQETPLGGDELGIYGYPNFNGPQAAGLALVDLGFDVVNIATNHMLDVKEKGLLGHINFWNQQPVTLLGGHLDDEDYENIRVVEKNGVKIAFLSYTYGLNGMTLPASSKIHIPLIDEKEITSMVGKAKKLADAVIVVMHWGTDGSYKVTTEQKSLAKAITAAGADVILGMHSHTIQPVEWQTRPDGGRTLVIYSLGNFISTQYDSGNLVGGAITFDIVKDKNGDVTIENPILNPVVTHYDKNRLGLQVYLLKDYTEELAKAHGTTLYGDHKTFTLADAYKFVTDAVDKEFLPDFMK
ncbi:MAG: CapA family protein [Clostridiales bacterium]|nr:CapA family protein [Clostridiales bacterium]